MLVSGGMSFCSAGSMRDSPKGAGPQDTSTKASAGAVMIPKNAVLVTWTIIPHEVGDGTLILRIVDVAARSRYVVSLPERVIRSLSAVSGGLLRELGNVALP